MLKIVQTAIQALLKHLLRNNLDRLIMKLSRIAAKLTYHASQMIVLSIKISSETSFLALMSRDMGYNKALIKYIWKQMITITRSVVDARLIHMNTLVLIMKLKTMDKD